MRNGTPISVMTGEAVEGIVEKGIAAYPFEACGVLTPDGRLIELPNKAQDPADGYELWLEDFEPYWEEGVVIWHTHPSGFVGPSKGDMQTRLERVHYLVVTLEGEATMY